MAIVESLLIALGTGVAKYLAKEALPKDWQDQIAAELVSLGVRQVSARGEEDPVATAIGKRLKPLYDRSTLAENDTQHSRPHADIVGWLGLYNAATPGVTGADSASVRLDHENMVQPDALLRLDAVLGGHSFVADDDYLAGPPELIVEIAASSVSYDMNVKRRVYARNGVQEYLAAQAYEQRVDWFVLREGVYEVLQPDGDGILRSEVFPGLWLPVDALWAGDLAGMIAVLQQGMASAEHAAFVAQLQGRLAATSPSANP